MSEGAVPPAGGIGPDIAADHVFDGGDLDCGSGLVLLIRESMARVPVGGILELRSREPSVGSDLPPWCKMVGHAFLGSLPGDGLTRYFVRRGEAPAERTALDRDKQQARQYEWRARVRGSGARRATVYCRNFRFETGQPASFEEKDENPSAVEYLLGALGSDLAVGFGTECARRGIALDDVELSVRGRLHNVLAHLGLEEGDPSLAEVEIKCFVSPREEGSAAAIQSVWEQTLARSPLAATLAKAADLRARLSIV